MINVLLLGGGLQGLSFGESLFKKKDINVSVVSNEYEIIKSRFFLHKYINKESGYGEWLKDIFGKERFDVIIPMGDKSASYLSKNRTEIEKEYNTKCAVPDYSVLSVVEDKSSFMAFCETHDIPHPRTRKLLKENINDVAREIHFPALIKPDYSVVPGESHVSILLMSYSLVSMRLAVNMVHAHCRNSLIILTIIIT